MWVAVFVPFTLLAVLRSAEGPFTDEEDYAHYLLHAQAIVDGRAYTDVGFIPTNLSPYGGPIARPPGLPLLLAPAVALGGMRSAIIPAMSIAMALAFLLLAAAAFRGREPALLLMTIGLVSGLQPNIIHFAAEPLSDLPFAALVWGVVMLTDSEERWTGWRVLAIALLGAAAISVRLAGIALIPALAVYGVLHFREQRLRTVVPLLVWCATLYLVASMLPTTSAPISQGSHAPPSALALALGSLRAYGYGVIEAQLYPFRADRLNQAFHAVTLSLLGIGVLSAVRTYWRSFVGLFTGSYIAMLLLLPVRDPRYLYPLVPVVVLLTMRLQNIITEPIRRPQSPESWRVATVAAGAAIVALMATAAQWTPIRTHGLRANPDAVQLLAAVRPLASERARVMSFKTHVLTLETGVDAMPIFGGAPAVIIKELCQKAISHVIIGDLGMFTKETTLLRDAVAAYPSAFREQYRNGSFVLWRFDAGLLRAADPATCPVRAPGAH